MSTPDTTHTANWDTNKHGRMAEYAAPDDAVTTITNGDETGD